MLASLSLILLCQLIGEAVVRGLGQPLPGPVLGLLLLRGPQTAHELLARAERMARFSSIEDLRAELDMLIGRRPPLIQEIPRGPGQREDRYVHLLAGPVDVAALSAQRSAPAMPHSDLEARLEALEQEVAALRARLDALGG